jgi:predicted MPP superfamily phosphohydrolase
MRRTPLAPPRRIRLSGKSTIAEWPVGGPAASPAPDDSQPPIAREKLDHPVEASEQRRRWFDPRGWFRNFERSASHFLSSTLYPRIPWLNLPYSRILERRLTLSEARIDLPDLPAPFLGLRILMISDIHAGPFVSPAALERTLGRLAALEPDLILLVGDLLTASADEWSANRRAFATLQAPLGTFAVLGNHEHYTREVERVIELIEADGIEVLNNRSRTLQRGGTTLSLAGVDDLLMGQPNLDAALDGTVGPVILMSHNPDLLFDAARHGVALMLSGHTHGGQIRLPGLPVLVRQSRYRLDEGRFTVDATQGIVSRGLGVVGVPVRLGCPPEAMLLTLGKG